MTFTEWADGKPVYEMECQKIWDAAVAATKKDVGAQIGRDTARLEWIETHLFVHSWSGAIGSLWNWSIAGDWRHTVQKMRGNTVRDAIDAAMGKK